MLIERFLPCLGWLRRYDGAALRGDALAAVIVTIMLIPQSLAYALLAGLPPQVGLYASMLPLDRLCASSAPPTRWRWGLSPWSR